MEPHCAWGFCSRWFFSIDFSPSALKTHVGIIKKWWAVSNRLLRSYKSRKSHVHGTWDMTWHDFFRNIFRRCGSHERGLYFLFFMLLHWSLMMPCKKQYKSANMHLPIEWISWFEMVYINADVFSLHTEHSHHEGKVTPTDHTKGKWPLPKKTCLNKTAQMWHLCLCHNSNLTNHQRCLPTDFKPVSFFIA